MSAHPSSNKEHQFGSVGRATGPYAAAQRLAARAALATRPPQPLMSRFATVVYREYY